MLSMRCGNEFHSNFTTLSSHLNVLYTELTGTAIAGPLNKSAHYGVRSVEVSW